jgi:hypothetical protein
MAWAAKSQIMTAQSVAGTELFSSIVDMNPGALHRLHIKGNSDGTTDNLVISIYSTADPSSEEWTTVADYSFELDCTDGNDNIIEIPLSGLYRYRVGCVRSGSTDTITTNIWYQHDGVDIS